MCIPKRDGRVKPGHDKYRSSPRRRGPIAVSFPNRERGGYVSRLGTPAPSASAARYACYNPPFLSIYAERAFIIAAFIIFCSALVM